MTRSRDRLRILVVAVLIAGCAPAGGGPSGALAPGSSAPTASARPSRADVSISPSASAPTPRASAPAVTLIDDPDLTIELPPGWRATPVAALRSYAEQASAAATGAIRDAYDQLIRDIDADAVRLYAFGPTGVDPWQGTLIIQVTDATSIEDQIERVTKFETAFAKPTSSARTDVQLSVGSGVRLEQTADPVSGQGVPARGINYVVELEDGRIMWISSTAPAESTTFAGMIDWAVTKTMHKR